ncbi:hypothetical protein, partial [Micrococcus sp. GbtcB5]|uniref:hypothetical protein n=1 Tax=Micrococcus sp. GbtcB5 TaxID=2824750 RepID=UPI0020C6A2EF
MVALQEGFPQLALALWGALARDAFTALGQLIRETGALQDWPPAGAASLWVAPPPPPPPEDVAQRALQFGVSQ